MESSRKRRNVLIAIGVAVALVAVWGFLALGAVSAARTDVDAAVDHLRRGDPGSGGLLRLLVSSDTQDDGRSAAIEARDELLAAAESFSDAESRLSSPLLAPARVLPFVGRQVRATTDLAGSAAAVSSDSATAIDLLLVVADTGSSTPQGRIDAVDETEGILGTLSDQLHSVDLGTDTGLVGSVADARSDFQLELSTLIDTVDDAHRAAIGMSQFLSGPTTYLVLAANNAEMRAGSGMVLQVGTISIRDGSFEMSDFVRSTELLLEVPGAELDPDIEANWGALLPNREWRNLNLSPRFDETARMAAQMWVAAGNPEVDGVMQLDIAAVRALLELTGPIEIGPDGQSIDAETVTNLLLRDQYTSSDHDERRDDLAVVASGVFEAANEREIAALDLLAMIESAGARRHMLLWSSHPDQQSAWEALGVSGEIDPDSLMVSLINRGGTKLDPYIALHSDLTVEESSTSRTVTVTTTITNSAPEWLPAYVQGPVDGSGGQAGEYVGILAVTAPAGAVDATTSAGGFAALGPDGPARLVASNVAVPRGAEIVVVTTFEVPLDLDMLRVLSAARLPRSTWTAGDAEWTEGRPRSVDIAELAD